MLTPAPTTDPLAVAFFALLPKKFRTIRSKYGYIESQAQLLVTNGSHVNARDSYDRSPLILVSLYLTGPDNWYNRERFGLLLLQHKADPNLADCYGLTPLIHAAINGQSDYVKVLLSDVSVQSLVAPLLHWRSLAQTFGSVRHSLRYLVRQCMS